MRKHSGWWFALLALAFRAEAAPSPLAPLAGRVAQSAQGDFNGDGQMDYAALVRGKGPAFSGDAAEGLQVFLSGAEGHRLVLDRPDFWRPKAAMLSGRSDLPEQDSLKLRAPKPGQLWLEAKGAGDDAMRLIAKFRWERGHFRLVGEEASADFRTSLWAETEGAHCLEALPGRAKRSLSINRLTGTMRAEGGPSAGRAPARTLLLEDYSLAAPPVFDQPFWNAAPPLPLDAKACPAAD